MKRLVYGCGYLGLRVARQWRDAGDHVTVVTRNQRHAGEFRAEGLDAVVADVTRPETLAPLAGLGPVDTLLFAVGFDRNAGPDIHQVYAEGLRNAILAAPSSVGRAIDISTTGVYGPADGGWVDEQTPPNPQREGGRASLAAEEHLFCGPLADNAVVLRLAGIYGPGRIPYLKELKAGEPIAAPATGWLNLIHVDDAARLIIRMADAEIGSQLYCVSDGSPVVRGDYYSQVAALLRAKSPVFVEPPANSPRAARAKSDKRISNRRLVDEIAPQWLFPSYREGLSSILGIDSAKG